MMGETLKGKVKLYVMGRELEQMGESEWKGKSERKLLKHIRSVQRGQVRMLQGALLLTHWSRRKGKKVEQNWHYEALYNMKEGRWHPQRKESRKTEPQFYFETVLCYGTLKQ